MAKPTGNENAKASNVKAAFARLLSDSKIAQKLRKNMGLGDTTGPLGVEFGGTGVSSMADLLGKTFDLVEGYKPSYTTVAKNWTSETFDPPSPSGSGASSPYCLVHFWGDVSFDAGKYIGFSFKEFHSYKGKGAVKVSGTRKNGTSVNVTFDYTQNLADSANSWFRPMLFSYVEGEAVDSIYVFGGYSDGRKSIVPTLRTFTLTPDGVMTFDETKNTGVNAALISAMRGITQDIGIFPTCADLIKDESGSAYNALIVGSDAITTNSSVFFEKIDGNGVFSHSVEDLGFSSVGTDAISSEVFGANEVYARIPHRQSDPYAVVFDLVNGTVRKLENVTSNMGAVDGAGITSSMMSVIDTDGTISRMKVNEPYETLVDLENDRVTVYNRRWFLEPPDSDPMFPEITETGDIVAVDGYNNTKLLVNITKNLMIPLYSAVKKTDPLPRYSSYYTASDDANYTSGAVNVKNVKMGIYWIASAKPSVMISKWEAVSV